MKTSLKTARQHGFMAELPDRTPVNLAGNYEYLEWPYYLSQDREIEGKTVVPSCRDMLDAYVVPLFLEKARVSGIPVPEYYLSNGYFEPPAIVDSINPFMSRSRTVLKSVQQKKVAKSLTRNYTYAVCCQELPANSRVEYFRSVLGWCVAPRYREISERLWHTMRIPLARVRIIRLPDGTMLASKMMQLPFKDLRQRELDHVARSVAWPA
jgi:hypothetical protein